MGNIERDIMENSKFIIKYFNDNGKDVTNLMLEKLLYFLEAIYMAITDDDKLYNEDFYAFEFGPVSKIIYNEYKRFGKYPIKISTANININHDNKKYIEFLFNLFKDYTPFDLVNLSHSKGSPWYEINEEYGGNIKKDVIIEKAATKKWFKGIIEKSAK